MFIAPCSHTFHYKCIRPLLDAHHPAFSCPLCRTFADLEEDVEVDIDPELDMIADEEGSDVPPKTAIELKDGKGLPMTPGTVVMTSSIRDRIEREAAEDAIGAGAETEVEHDLGFRMTRIGGSRWQRLPMPGGMAVDVPEADDEDEAMANQSHSPSPDLNRVLEAANRDQSLSPIPVVIPSRLIGHDEFIVEGGDIGNADGFGEEHTLSKHKPVIN